MASFVRTLLNRAPVPYTGSRRSSMLSLGSGSSSSRTAQMQAMGSVGTLFSIVNRTSNATAQVEWKLYRKAANGNEGERVEVTSHAALDLWNKPNPFMPRQEFVESFQQHLDLTGEAWWVLYRDPRATMPLEMWPVRPDRMEPLPSAENFLVGYIYTGPDGEKVPLALNEVIFLRMPNPLDIYRGMGPVQSILTDLDASRYSAEWNKNFFLNSAEPGGVIAVDRRLEDHEFEEMRLRWAEQHRGVAAAHRVAIIEQGAQWVDRKFTQRDMQFAELRSVSRDVIREAFGMPAFALGEVQDVNRATADASRVWFAEQMTVPRLERIKGALNFDLLPMYGTTGQGLEFDYCSPVPDDEEAENAELTAKANAAATLVAAGYEPAAVLAAVGLPDMPYQPSAPALPVTTAQPTNSRPRAAHHHSSRLRLRDSGDDLEDVRADYDRALASLTTTWDAIEDAWIRHLEDQIADAIDGDDTAALAGLAVDTGDAVHALRGALATMASQAADRLVQEAAAQGVHITAPALDSALTNRAAGTGSLRAAYGSDLVDVATVTATLLASGLAASAAREALRLMRPDAAGRSIAAAVGSALRSAKGWFRRDQLGAALHRAQNTGRLAAIDAGPPGPVITATEVHDGNRCGPCSDIDGTEFPSVDEAEAAYGTGGYIDCDGGIRCRGTVVATWP